MTNEQREAIDRLDKDKDYPLACGDITIVNVEAIEIVLSLIKEQQGEIEGLKNKEVLIKRYFKKCDLIKQLKKQIDLMAEYISKQDVEEDICMKNKTNPDWCNEDYTTCKDCIKQYFERKVE